VSVAELSFLQFQAKAEGCSQGISNQFKISPLRLPPRFQWDGDFGRPPKVDPPPAENDTEVLCNIHLCGNDIRTIEKSVVIPAKTGIHFIYGQYS